jgi:hypothetical protein
MVMKVIAFQAKKFFTVVLISLFLLVILKNIVSQAKIEIFVLTFMLDNNFVISFLISLL